MNDQDYRDYIKRLVDEMPPLTQEQSRVIAAALQVGAEKATKQTPPKKSAA